MKRNTLRLVGAVVIGSVALAVTGGSASASTAVRPRPVAFVKAKARCNLEIDRRLWTLAGLRNRIDHSTRITDEQQAPMLASIDETSALLRNLYRPAVNNARTPEELRSACQAIVVDLRIFVVYVPQTIYTAFLDALSNWQVLLQQKVDDAAAGGADTTGLQALLDDSQAKLDDAAAKIPSVTPESWNTDPDGVRATWEAVRSDIHGSLADLMRVRAGLPEGVAV